MPWFYYIYLFKVCMQFLHRDSTRDLKLFKWICQLQYLFGMQQCIKATVSVLQKSKRNALIKGYVDPHKKLFSYSPFWFGNYIIETFCYIELIHAKHTC